MLRFPRKFSIVGICLFTVKYKVKAFFDLLPVICFFITYKMAGGYTAEIQSIFPVAADLVPIVAATAVIIVASVLQIGIGLARGHKPTKMAIFSTVLVVIFGGLTIWLQNPAFIMWKPTLLYWLFAGILLVGHYRGTNYMKVLFSQLTMPEHVWVNLEKMWFVFLVAIGFVNIAVAYTCSMDFWVDFKLFGLLGLTLLFTIAIGFYVAKYAQEAQNNK